MPYRSRTVRFRAAARPLRAAMWTMARVSRLVTTMPGEAVGPLMLAVAHLQDQKTRGQQYQLRSHHTAVDRRCGCVRPAAPDHAPAGRDRSTGRAKVRS